MLVRNIMFKESDIMTPLFKGIVRPILEYANVSIYYNNNNNNNALLILCMQLCRHVSRAITKAIT